MIGWWIVMCWDRIGKQPFNISGNMIGKMCRKPAGTHTHPTPTNKAKLTWFFQICWSSAITSNISIWSANECICIAIRLVNNLQPPPHPIQPPKPSQLFGNWRLAQLPFLQNFREKKFAISGVQGIPIAQQGTCNCITCIILQGLGILANHLGWDDLNRKDRFIQANHILVLLHICPGDGAQVAVPAITTWLQPQQESMVQEHVHIWWHVLCLKE